MPSNPGLLLTQFDSFKGVVRVHSLKYYYVWRYRNIDEKILTLVEFSLWITLAEVIFLEVRSLQTFLLFDLLVFKFRHITFVSKSLHFVIDTLIDRETMYVLNNGNSVKRSTFFWQRTTFSQTFLSFIHFIGCETSLPC